MVTSLLLGIIWCPFEWEGQSLALEQPMPKHQTSASLVTSTDIGPGTVGRRTQRTDLPEDLLHKETSDIFKVDYFDNLSSFSDYEMNNSDINVKGRLKRSVIFWEKINTSDYILDVIKHGYKIPLLKEPDSIFLNNNRSAIDNSDFVCLAISDLVKGGLVREVKDIPHVVNPLTVSINAKGKHRLILDLRHVNKQVVVDKIKFEDLKTAKQYVQPGCFGYSFDLKAGYHHIDVCTEHQKYLGFTWTIEGKKKYFVFTVLPFGLSSSAYIFTKVVRPLVKNWRLKGIKTVVYLDDGFGTEETYQVCKKNADIVKADLISAGFVPNKDKCKWEPSREVEWLGFTWDLNCCVLKIPDRKKVELLELIKVILSKCTKVKVRLLAKLAGKVISFTPALGDITQIMTRGIFAYLQFGVWLTHVIN